MPTIRELLDRSRRELFDLSTRNRLLSVPINSKSPRIVRIHDELTEQAFRLLVQERKGFGLLAVSLEVHRRGYPGESFASREAQGRFRIRIAGLSRCGRVQSMRIFARYRPINRNGEELGSGTR